MRRIMGVSLLSLVLACSAYAGEMPYGITGEMPNGAIAQSTAATTSVTQEPQASDPVTEIATTILTSVLSII